MVTRRGVIYIGYKISVTQITELLTNEEISKMRSEGYLHFTNLYANHNETDCIIGVIHEIIGEGCAVALGAGNLDPMYLKEIRDDISKYINYTNLPVEAPNYIFGLEVS